MSWKGSWLNAVGNVDIFVLAEGWSGQVQVSSSNLLSEICGSNISSVFKTLTALFGSGCAPSRWQPAAREPPSVCWLSSQESLVLWLGSDPYMLSPRVSPEVCNQLRKVPFLSFSLFAVSLMLRFPRASAFGTSNQIGALVTLSRALQQLHTALQPSKQQRAERGCGGSGGSGGYFCSAS